MAGETRRRRRKAARPSEIIDAGFSEFAEKGFAAARLEDVAARAGIAKPTIYLYFPSKEALFEAAVRDRLVGAMEGFEASSLGFEGPTEVLLRDLLQVLYDRLIGTGAVALLRIVIAEGGRFAHLASLYHDVALSRGIGVIGAVLERGIARGEIRQCPAAADPRIVVAPAIVAALWSQVFARESPLDRDAYFEAHLDLVLNGLSVRRAPDRDPARGGA
ncbi:MAG: TetR/AcrR family transcriptional regulator [Salinarimonas sp.]